MANQRKETVAVVGAGLGGISAAISLATEGFSVELFEKNDKIGGKLNVLEDQGFTFDLGPSILTMPHIFSGLFARAGKSMADYVEIEEVSPHWRNFFEDGTVIDLTPDMRRCEEELAKLPPDESYGFFKFLEYSRLLCRLTEEGYFAKGLDTTSQLVAYHGVLASAFKFDVLRSMHGGIARFIRNEKMREILGYFAKYVGSSPYDAPAVLNLLPYVQFGYGLWYVSGGMYNLARGLERLARETGVTIRLNTEVVEITRSGRRVTGLRLRDGTNVAADIVVSNVEVIAAYRDLLHEDERFLKKYAKFAPACSGLVLHLGVDRRYPQLAHHNVFYSRGARKHFQSVFHDQVLSEDPTIYLVAPVNTDPSQAPPDCDIIKVLPHIPHIRDRDPFSESDYREFRERVLVKLERMGLKDLRQHIVVEHMWTPHDIQRLYHSNKGAIYGVVSDRSLNRGLKAPKRSSAYANLYFVGGSVNPGAGMPMVVLSGQQVRDMVLEDVGMAR